MLSGVSMQQQGILGAIAIRSEASSFFLLEAFIAQEASAMK